MVGELLAGRVIAIEMMREPKSWSVNIDTAKYAHIMIWNCLCLMMDMFVRSALVIVVAS